MRYFVNYLKNGRGRGLIPMLIFTLLSSGFVGYAIYSYFKFYVQVRGIPLPPTDALLGRFILPVALCFFIILWMAFLFQTFFGFLFAKACRFQFNKGAIWRTSMVFMILFWVFAVGALFTPLGFKLWMVLDFYYKSALESLYPILGVSPYISVPAIVIVMGMVWALVPALLEMIALIFLRNKEWETLLHDKEQEAVQKIAVPKESKKKKKKV